MLSRLRSSEASAINTEGSEDGDTASEALEPEVSDSVARFAARARSKSILFVLAASIASILRRTASGPTTANSCWPFFAASARFSFDGAGLAATTSSIGVTAGAAIGGDVGCGWELLLFLPLATLASSVPIGGSL